MTKKSPTTKNNKLIISIIAGTIVAGAIIAGIILATTLANKNSDYPQDLAALKTALANKDALNCTIEHTEEANAAYTIQTTKDWDKVRLIPSANKDSNMEILIIKDSGTYIWSDETAIKTIYDASYIDELEDLTSEDFSEDSDEIAKIKVTCSNPSNAKFDIPNKNWTDLTNLTDEE